MLYKVRHWRPRHAMKNGQWAILRISWGKLLITVLIQLSPASSGWLEWQLFCAVTPVSILKFSFHQLIGAPWSATSHTIHTHGAIRFRKATCTIFWYLWGWIYSDRPGGKQDAFFLRQRTNFNYFYTFLYQGVHIKWYFFPFGTKHISWYVDKMNHEVIGTLSLALVGMIWWRLRHSVISLELVFWRPKAGVWSTWKANFHL